MLFVAKHRKNRQKKRVRAVWMCLGALGLAAVSACAGWVSSLYYYTPWPNPPKANRPAESQLAASQKPERREKSAAWSKPGPTKGASSDDRSSFEKDSFFIGTCSTTAAATEVKSEPSAASATIFTAPKGMMLYVTPSSVPGWLRVTLTNDHFGFVGNLSVFLGEDLYQTRDGLVALLHKDGPGPTSQPAKDYLDRLGSSISTAPGPSPNSAGTNGNAYSGLSSISIYAATGSGHWINSVSDEGRIITLEDESVWEVDPTDTVDSALWLPTSDITVIESNTTLGGYRLINKDDGETVGAKFISR